MKFNSKKILGFITTVVCALSAFSMVAMAADGANASAKEPKGTIPMGIVLVVYILFFVVVGYFLIYRPNKKRKKQEEELRSSIILGDEVTTIGGIVGRVVNIKDDNITIETSLDKTLMEFKNWAIREVKKPISDDEPESK